MSVYYVCNRCHETDLGPTGAGMSCWECATGGKDTSTNTDLDFGEMIGPGADAFWDIPQEDDYFQCSCCASTLDRDREGKFTYRSTWESCFFCQADYCGSCTNDTTLSYCKKCRVPFCNISRDEMHSCAEFCLNLSGYCKECRAKPIKGTHCF